MGVSQKGAVFLSLDNKSWKTILACVDVSAISWIVDLVSPLGHEEETVQFCRTWTHPGAFLLPWQVGVSSVYCLWTRGLSRTRGWVLGTSRGGIGHVSPLFMIQLGF